MFNACLPAKSRFQYLRLRITAVCDEAGVDAPAGPAALRDLRYLVAGASKPGANLAGNTASPPYIASASLEIDDRFAYYAFDGDADSYWRGGAMGIEGVQYLQIYFGPALAVRPSAVRIVPHSTYFISAFSVLASNSGAFLGEQRTLYTTSGVTSGWTAGVARTFSF